MVVLVLFMMFIPASMPLRKRANEASALNTMHSIYRAEQSYASLHPEVGFTCSLKDLLAPSVGDRALAVDMFSEVKSGYYFSLSSCSSAAIGGKPRITSYKVTAVPVALGKSGNKGFCAGEAGKLSFDPDGGNHCTKQVD